MLIYFQVYFKHGPIDRFLKVVFMTANVKESTRKLLLHYNNDVAYGKASQSSLLNKFFNVIRITE